MPNKDVIEGQLKHAEGHALEVVGDLTDNPKLQAEGECKKREGKAQETVGHLKEAVVSATHKTTHE